MQALLRGVERVLVRVERVLVRIELGIALLAFAAMLGLALTDIIGRNFFQTTVPDGDILLRQLVLWVAMPGAALALAARRHLALDPANLAERPGWLRATRIPFNLFAALVCGFLAHAAWRYGVDEFASADATWLAVSAWVLPAGFGLLALHCLLRAGLRD